MRSELMRRRYAAMPRSVYLSLVGFAGLVSLFNLAVVPVVRGADAKAIALAIGLGAGAFVVVSVWYRGHPGEPGRDADQFGRQFAEMSRLRYSILVAVATVTVVIMAVSTVVARSVFVKVTSALAALSAAVLLWTAVSYRRKLLRD
jgi:hypothetical protein